MRHLLISVPLAALATLWMTSAVLAGGWAVTTLDPLPHSMQAGQTYQIGYTIRQHGVTPFTQGTPQIRINSANQQITFRGRPVGEPGHYVSEVVFPSEGEWTWTADPMPFPSQPLGTITIQPASLAVTEAKAPPPVELGALLGLIGLFGLVGLLAVYSTARFREPGGWLRACLGRSMRHAREV
jgi:hypothetical protein